MTVAVFTHPDCLRHDPGPGHPESPARLARVLAVLREPAYAALQWHEAPLATRAQIQAVHPGGYLDALAAAEPAGTERVALDTDTLMSAGSVAAALRAAGGACAAVDAVLGGQVAHGFAAVRPPGHHAEPRIAMGFCLFNGVAVAALHARARWSIERIAVLDFDVHHGNGTQASFQADPALFYASTHQSPCYPGTGAARETGVAGNVANRPLAPGAGSTAFRAAWTELLERLAAFGPELVIVSAGFDAHAADPLAQLTLAAEDFAWIAGRIAAAGGGRTVSVLEGGYDLDALGQSVAAYVGVLMDEVAA